MKRNYPILLILLVFFAFAPFSEVSGQSVACPQLTANNPVLPCGVTCATLVATPNVNLAATTSYAVSSVSYAPFSYTTGTIPTFSGAVWSTLTDDSYGDLITLPFNFCFFGNTYNHIVIGTNGNISFNTAGAGSLVNAYDPYIISGPLPGSNCTATKNCIMGVWNDTYVGAGPIRYATYGTAPCREFVISWDSCALYLPGSFCDGNTTTSQIVLYETLNVIDVYIGRRAPCASWNGGLAVCGIENAAGTVYYCPAGENGTTFTASNLGWRFTPTGTVAPWSYVWTGPGGSTIGTADSVVVCPAAGGPAVYSVTATATGCTGTINISTTATITYSGTGGAITGITTVCVGDTSTLHETTTGGTWASSNSSIATIDPVTGFVTGLAAGTVTISYTDTTCTANTVFNVVAIPAVTVSAVNPSLCLGGSTAITAAGATTYTWTPSTGLSASTGSTVTCSATSTTTYTVTGTVGAGCTNTATQIITVNPIPTITATAVSPTICTGTSTAITASGGNTYSWTPATGLSATTGSTVTCNATTTTTYTVTGTSAAGCSNTVIVTITVNPLPVVTGTAVSPSICLGSSTAITASGAATYTWSPSAGLSATTGTTVTCNATSTTIYTITGTSAAGCVNTGTVTITVNPIPTITATAVSPAICLGSSTAITAAGGSTYTWTPATGLSASTGATVTCNATSTTTYTVTGTSAAGCSSTATITITVNPLPVVTATAATPAYCIGGSSSITASGAVTYSWSPAVGLSATTGATVTSSTTITRTYTVTGTSATGCHNTATVTITVNPLPVVTGTAVSSSICIGSSTNITAAGASTYTWSPAAGLSATTGATVTCGATTTTSYLITGTSVAGCVDTTTVTITVNPLPTVIAAAVSPTICSGNSTVINAGGASTYTWSPSTGLSASTGATVTCSAVSTTTYTVTGTSGAGCVHTTTITITVNPLPVITATASVPSYCIGGSSGITASGAVSYTWSPSTGLSATTGTSVGCDATVTTVYTVTGLSALGCTGITTQTITVYPIPPAPTVSPETYCQFATAPPVSAIGSALTWYGPGITSAMSVAPTPSTAVPGTMTYYVTQTVFGCVSDSATEIVTIIPKPAPPTTRDTSYCQFFGGAVPLDQQVTGAYGAAFNWFTLAGGALSGAPVPSTLVYDYPSGTTWYVSQVVNGCASNTAPVTVTVLPTPEFAVHFQSPVCAGDSLDVSYSLNAGSLLVGQAYTWIIPANSYLSNNTSLSDPGITLKFDSTILVTTTGYLTISNLAGACSTTDTFTLTVYPVPVALAYTKPNVCFGDTVSLALVSRSNDALNFLWYFDDTLMSASNEINVVKSTSNTDGPYTIAWEVSGLHIVDVVTVNAYGCASKPMYDTINVHLPPNAGFTITPINSNTLCLEDSMLFSAYLQDDSYTYLWQPSHFFNNDNKAYVYGKVEEAKSLVTLTVTDPFGCKASVTNEVDPNLCCTVSFPSAFTPNGDGKNDFFRPIFAGFHRFHNFRVCNRYGQIVFESADTYPEWDGKFNGEQQDMGVYYYYLKYDCGGQTLTQKGDCTLVR